MSDYISNLPDNLIEQIIASLPSKEAVRTSALSKGWRYRWITVPQLVFDCSTFSSSEHSNKFPAFFRQVLLQHEGSLSRFKLAIPGLYSRPEIDHSIRFLTRKNIEEFTLLIQDEDPHKIPSDLYSCVQLKFLCLEKCVLEPPPDFAGFSTLRTVKFTALDLPAGLPETFLVKCPLLESLTLHRCSNLDGISFDAPNLKILDYIGCVAYLCFKNTPGLTKVAIYNYVPVYKQSWKRVGWMETFCSLRTLKYLHLRERFFGIMALGVIPMRPENKFDSLETLVLTGIVVGHWCTAMYLIPLFKCTPNLRKLKVQFYENMPNDEPLAVKLYSKGVEAPVFFLPKLQLIQLSYFKCLVAEMELIKLLLSKSPVLETMHIFHIRESTAEKTLAVAEMSNQWRRASPRAQVFFNRL